MHGPLRWRAFRSHNSKSSSSFSFGLENAPA
jgi:hypothetical protein